MVLDSLNELDSILPSHRLHGIFLHVVHVYAAILAHAGNSKGAMMKM